MKRLTWFERELKFGLPKGMLPFYLERLDGTLLRLEEKVKGFSEEQLSKQLNGKWSVKQNIGHLSEVDEIAMKRIDEMLTGVPTLSPAVFEPRADYNVMTVRDVLQRFRNTRKANFSIYRMLREDELEKSSIHPRLKVPMTPVDLAWFDAEHDDHHLVTINEILKALSK